MRLKVSNVCQLINKAKIDATKTVYGVTFTNDGSGVVVANGGPSTGQGAFYVDRALVIDPTHIYLTPKSADIPGTCAIGCDLYGDSGYIPGSKNGFERDVPFKFNSQGTIAVFYYVIFANKTVTNLRLIPQLFDLTEMYGVGHEPTTVEQFRQDFPNEMYEYSPVCWKKFRRLKYVANKEPVQLLNKSEFRETHVNNGITYTNNGNGTFTLNGTTTSASRSSIYPSDSNTNIVKANHKYLMLGFPIALDGNNYVYFQYYPFNTSIKYYILNNSTGYLFFTPTDDGDRWNIFLSFKTTGFVVNNITIKPQLFDLTEMYGAGNEPTTVVQFRADFPNELYDYNPYNYLTLNRGKYIANKEPVQLLDKTKYRGTVTTEGITFTNNGDGTWTVVGTAPDDPINHSYVAYSILYFSKEFTQKYFIPGHKIVVGGGKVNYDAFVQWILGWTGGYIASNSSANYPYTITEYPENFSNYIELRVNKGKTVNFTFNPQFFDLTAMYGEGNEPTTVAQFRADFPNALYDYNPYNAITFR